MNKKKSFTQSKLFIVLSTLLIISLSIFIFSLLYQNELPKIVEEINNSAIGAILTAIVTVFLLQGQTATEEERDKNLSVFEKKQEVYHNFLEKLKGIIMDGEIKIAQYGEDADMRENVDELKELLFELGYIQMHTSEENTKKIFTKVSDIIKALSDFSSEGIAQQQLLPQFYGSLSEHLFEIVSILKSDLYGIDTKAINKSDIANLLQECGLYIEQKEMDKYDIQNYFWNELQNNLKKKGYEFTKKDFSQDVNKFYGIGKSHRWYGFEIPIYTTKQNEKIFLSVSINNDYVYGFKKENNPNNELFIGIANELKTDANPNWYGYKYSSRFNLNFTKMDSPSFEVFANSNKNKKIALLKNIAHEIDSFINNFKEKAKNREL